jgi:transposase
MKVKKTKHTAKFKGKLALEALRGDKTIQELASKNALHPTQITRWRKQLEGGIDDIFDTKRKKDSSKKVEAKEAELFEEIGRLKYELDWLKKKAAKFD